MGCYFNDALGPGSDGVKESPFQPTLIRWSSLVLPYWQAVGHVSIGAAGAAGPMRRAA